MILPSAYLVIIFIDERHDVALLPKLAAMIDDLPRDDGGDARGPANDGPALLEKQVPTTNSRSGGPFDVSWLPLWRNSGGGSRISYGKKH